MTPADEGIVAAKMETAAITVKYLRHYKQQSQILGDLNQVVLTPKDWSGERLTSAQCSDFLGELVTRYNNHDALVAALRGYVGTHDDPEHPHPDDACHCNVCVTARALLTRIEAEGK